MESEPYEKHLKGEKRPFKKRNHLDIYNSSGCRFDLSSEDFNNFTQQKIDAINFLKKNKKGLLKMTDLELKESETPVIGFGIENQMADFWCQQEYLQPELLKLSGELNIGIEISLYHPTEEDNNEDK